MLREFGRLAALAGLLVVCLFASTANAQDISVETAVADTGDTAWILTSSALVLFMTLPGLALFYGGLVRARNLLSVIMHCFAICCVVSLLWVLFGYSLAFTEGDGYIGSMSRAFLASTNEALVGTLPENAFVLFQMTFAIITPALMVGAFVERVRFGFVVAFSAVWLVLVYLPACHWVWGGGWLYAHGVLDFAGGIVVHTTAGISALVVAAMLGPRADFPRAMVPPHSPGLTMAGGAMLWVGWFGFNGGSALAAGSGAASAILATHLAASAAALTWIGIEWLRNGKPTSVGMVTGCIAGLATITPASGFVSPIAAIFFGVISGGVCLYAVTWVKMHLKIDDTLDVFAVHGVGGMLGSILVAFFVAAEWGGAGYAPGMNFSSQLYVQTLGVLATAVWSGALTFVIVKLLTYVTGLRVPADQEREGLDITAHGERAYENA